MHAVGNGDSPPKKKYKRPVEPTKVQLSKEWKARVTRAFKKSDTFNSESAMLGALVRDALRHYEAQNFKFIDYGTLELPNRDESPNESGDSSPKQ